MGRDSYLAFSSVPRTEVPETDMARALRLQVPVAAKIGSDGKPITGPEPMSAAQFQALRDGSLSDMNRKALNATTLPTFIQVGMNRILP